MKITGIHDRNRPAKGAIFDFDGTIADSMWIWKDVDQVFLAERGEWYDEAFGEAMRTLSFQQAARYTKERFGFTDSVESIARQWFDMAEERYRTQVNLKPGALECLKRLRSRGIPLALCTASVSRLILAALQNIGIADWFVAVVTAEDVPVPKSEPDIYLHGAELLGVAPDDCVVFEDVLHGLISAKEGGFRTVAVFDPSAAADWANMVRIADHALPKAFADFEAEPIFGPGGWF